MGCRDVVAMVISTYIVLEIFSALTSPYKKKLNFNLNYHQCQQLGQSEYLISQKHRIYRTQTKVHLHKCSHLLLCCAAMFLGMLLSIAWSSTVFMLCTFALPLSAGTNVFVPVPVERKIHTNRALTHQAPQQCGKKKSPQGTFKGALCDSNVNKKYSHYKEKE